MKFATFEIDRQERWGLVVKNPNDDRMWVFEPQKAEEIFKKSAAPTNGFFVSLPRFMPEGKWPDDLVGFLRLGEEGMDRMRRFEAFLLRFLVQSDQYRICQAGHPLDSVHLRAPIPRPRLMWGLVANSPSFWRSDPNRRMCNFMPQGHQRPIGSIIGHNEIFLHASGFNVELGVVIGKKGKDIPVGKAMEHVAGYTVVIDSQISNFYKEFDPEYDGTYSIENKYDWFVGATCSWAGKKSDAHCVMGPTLVTKDEIGNVYDLLVYTRQSGMLRDRSHTAGMSLGIERTIAWYSTFATLYPGDVIHMGTMGTDGLGIDAGMHFGAQDFIESEIENIGVLRAKVLDETYGDWRAPDDMTKQESIIPAVRDYIRSGNQEIVSPGEWKLEKVNNVYTCFVNYADCYNVEGFLSAPSPRFLNGPNSSLGISGGNITLAKRATTLDIGVELAFVVKKLASCVSAKDAENYILGYTPLISVSDRSFREVIIEPSTPQERNITTVYARWGDGYNVVLETPVKVNPESMRMCLEVEDIGTVCGSTAEYTCGASKVMEFISRHITLFPGDVVTLGRIAQRVTIPKEKVVTGLKIKASIEGLGQISTTLCSETL